jgi:hypothetical protein
MVHEAHTDDPKHFHPSQVQVVSRQTCRQAVTLTNRSGEIVQISGTVQSTGYPQMPAMQYLSDLWRYLYLKTSPKITIFLIFVLFPKGNRHHIPWGIMCYRFNMARENRNFRGLSSDVNISASRGARNFQLGLLESSCSCAS